jgi:hypothetical protein
MSELLSLSLSVGLSNQNAHARVASHMMADSGQAKYPWYILRQESRRLIAHLRPGLAGGIAYMYVHVLSNEQS